MNATLASTISNQYNRQSDLYLANSLQHDERINMIQIGRKRRIRQPSRLEVMQQQRMYKDPNPVARMNRFGYDGPNRHQFGGNKIPIPERYFHPQSDQPRYPQMQSAPLPPRSPPPHRFSSNRGHNNNTPSSQNSNQNNTSLLSTRTPILTKTLRST